MASFGFRPLIGVIISKRSYQKGFNGLVKRVSVPLSGLLFLNTLEILEDGIV